MIARRVRIGLWSLLALAGALALAAGSGARGGTAQSIEFTGTVDPATEGWMDKALGEAEEEGARLAIIRLDTPGGLDTSTREIVKDIIAAPMPVVVYVSPDGARAASAGLFITQAADVAAMSPQTNIGSATPVSIGPGEQDEVLGRKIENDAAAYVRALAEVHGRNGDLAARMVTEAENVTAGEALEAGLIDVVASDEEELLRKLNGFRVQGPKEQKLDTVGMEIEERDMPLQYDLLQLIVNPTVSFLLLLAGLAGIAFEIFHPGLILPGSLGAVALLLGLYGTAQLPVTLTGILLLLAAVVLFIAEAHLPTGGLLGAVGLAALVAAGLLLYDTDSEAFEVSEAVIVVVTLLVGGLALFMGQRVLAARRRPVMTGWEELIGKEGEVRVPLAPIGQVFVEGALWRARAADEGTAVDRGYRVRVESVDGLTLLVRPLGPDERSDREAGARSAAGDTEDKATEGAG